MRITASGGTDTANIVLFWPDNLPDDADALFKKDPLALVERLRGEGKLIRFPCFGDGAYSVAIYLDEPLPEELRAVCVDEQRYPVVTAQGTGYFGALEGLFQRDSRYVEKYPGMCEPVDLPEGTYSAAVYETDFSEELYESWLLEHAGPEAKGLWDLHNSLAALAVFGVLGSLIAFFFVSWLVWGAMLAVVAGFIIAAVATSRTEGYRSAAQAEAEFAKAYPSYVVHLKASHPARRPPPIV